MGSEFAVLRAGRRRLLDFCSFHKASVEHFSSGVSFRLSPDEPELDGKSLRHMTSTATCLESLTDCPDVDVTERVARFIRQALAKKKWQSEGSAGIYCRCRALPFVIQHAAKFDRRIETHLERILYQLDDGNRFAVGEADQGDPPARWYPPNAFHTFWTLEALRRLRRFPESKGFERRHDIPTRSDAMVLWAWQVLGCQMGLHQAKSSGLDTDQLIWALNIVTQFQAQATYSPLTIRYRDLIKRGIETFFEAQDPNTGTWPHHEPLFHYREAGNAYCFVFESLIPLLRTAAHDESVLLRALLRPYATHLFRLLDHAEATKVPLSADRAFGWSSGHRTNMPFPESWATATVFSCMEALRRVVGIWTKEDALKDLNHFTPTESPDSAIDTLSARGNTWSDTDTVAEQLLTMFVNPIRMVAASQGIDPDDRPIAADQSRSAILFGPPGTSKTTLARMVAAAIGWEYVELQPSHFVAAGLPNVQRTADDIFTKLMELDRCVVLFDEIDELMREREKEPDAFGRFLTTSMLPKLAELWQQRRIIYFVATNHVEHFDRALTRSERFDALILVPPPAFAIKIARLKTLITELAPGHNIRIVITAADIRHAFELLSKGPAPKSEGLHDEHLLAKFLLIRWDQLDELAHLVVRISDSRAQHRLDVDADIVKEALRQLGDNRLKEYGPYLDFLRDRSRAGRDFGKRIVWQVSNPSAAPLATRRLLSRIDGQTWCTGTKDTIRMSAGRTKITFSHEGRITFRGLSRPTRKQRTVKGPHRARSSKSRSTP